MHCSLQNQQFYDWDFSEKIEFTLCIHDFILNFFKDIEQNSIIKKKKRERNWRNCKTFYSSEDKELKLLSQNVFLQSVTGLTITQILSGTLNKGIYTHTEVDNTHFQAFNEQNVSKES